MLSKSDLLPAAEAEKKARAIVRTLRFKGPWFLVSGVTGAGTRALTEAVMTFLEERAAAEAATGTSRAAFYTDAET